MAATCQELACCCRLNCCSNKTQSQGSGIFQLGNIATNTSAWHYVLLFKSSASLSLKRVVYRCCVLLKYATVRGAGALKQNFDRKLKLRLSKNSAVHSVSAHSSVVWGALASWLFLSVHITMYWGTVSVFQKSRSMSQLFNCDLQIW